MTELGSWFLAQSSFVQGVLASFVAGMGTALGAVPVFLVRRLAPVVEDGLLGFSAGVMLAASFFSLLLPALELTGADGGPWTAAAVASLGLLAGAVCLELIHRLAPHEHFVLGHEGPSGSSLYRIWLFIITSEMIPEMQQRGHKTVTAWTLMGGFLLMMILDVALG